MSKSRSRREVMEPALTAYARGEPEQLMALADDMIDYETMAKSPAFPFGGRGDGKASLMKTIAMIAQDWQCLQFKLGTWVEQEPWVAFRAATRFRSLHSGNEVDLEFGVFCRFADDRIVVWREFWDSLRAYEAAVGPVPDRAR